MRTRPATVVVALLLISLTACGGRAARDQNRAMLEAPGEKWFCQVAEDLENWDCEQSDRLAAAPQPERMPVPLVSDAAESGRDDGRRAGGLAYDPFAGDGPVPSTEGGSVPSTEGGSVPSSEGGSVPSSEGRSVPSSDGPVPSTGPETDAAPSPQSPESVPAAEPESDAVPDVGDDSRAGAAAEDDAQAPSTGPVAAAVQPASVEPALAAAPEKSQSVAALPILDAESMADDTYVIQLVAMRSVTTLEQVVRDRDLQEVLIARVAANEDIYYVLLAGPYADEIAAQEVATNPPPELADFQLWVRSGRSLAEAMREADALARDQPPGGDPTL